MNDRFKIIYVHRWNHSLSFPFFSHTVLACFGHPGSHWLIEWIECSFLLSGSWYGTRRPIHLPSMQRSALRLGGQSGGPSHRCYNKLSLLSLWFPLFPQFRKQYLLWGEDLLWLFSYSSEPLVPPLSLVFEMPNTTVTCGMLPSVVRLRVAQGYREIWGIKPHLVSWNMIP